MLTDTEKKAIKWFADMDDNSAQALYLKYESLIGSDRIVTDAIKAAIYTSEMMFPPSTNTPALVEDTRQYQLEPKDLVDWIDKKGLPETKSILNELKVINLTSENTALKGRVKQLEDVLNSILNQPRVNNNYADTCAAMQTKALKGLQESPTQ